MTAKKILLYAARAAGSLAACALAFAALWRYEYPQQLTQIDNIIGMIPLAFGVLFAGCICALLWMPHGKRTAALAVCLAATSLLTAALFPLAVRGNWWIDYGNGSGEGAGPDLTLYSPFEEDTLAATLEEEAALHLAGELPVLDGATALYPLYAAFAQAVYEEEDYAAGLTEGTVRCTNTANAYEAVVSGEADIIFVAGPSEKQKQAAADAGAELVLTPIGREAFVFIVGKSNPVEGLSYQQIRNIYSGKTAHWRTLGWEEGGSIIAFQRPEGSGSQSGLQRVMGDMPIVAPQPLPDKSLVGSNSLMQQVSVWWKGVQPALGYSYRYYAQTMYANQDTKLLAIDGYSPTEENIRSGDYPFVNNFYAVTNGEPTGKAKQLIDWICGQQGQELIVKTGYTPL